MRKTKEQINELVRLRYSYYRSLGYTGVEARKLSKKKINIEIDLLRETDETYRSNKEKTKTIKPKTVKNEKVKNEKDFDLDEYIKKEEHKIGVKRVNNYVKKFKKTEGQVIDTTLTDFGKFTHDNRYKDDTASVVRFIEDDNNLNTNQAYYFIYLMYQYGYTYNQVKRQITIDEKFELYKQMNYGKRF